MIRKMSSNPRPFSGRRPTASAFRLVCVWAGLQIGLALPGVHDVWAEEATLPPPKLSNTTLTLESVFTQLETGHPLLMKSLAGKVLASGKLLKALGQFEPKLVNDWELERLVKSGSTKNVGFNDTFIELRHPWGIKGFAGFRAGIGDVEVADLGINTTNQPLLGIVVPLLRGFITNPAHGELKKSSLADKQAGLEIQQTRQDLYLGAATQYWNWAAAWNKKAIREKAVGVAQERMNQLSELADAGSLARFDVIDANGEIQRRKEILIRAKRKVEQEQYKLALFLWEGDSLIVPDSMSAPDFFSPQDIPPPGSLDQDKQRAIATRPEIHQVNLEAEFNQIDLEVAENDLLPDLEVMAEPTRKPGEFVLGLGYRFGVQFSMPFLQKKARGEILQIQGKTEQLKQLQRYRIQQVSMDVANAHSSMKRARERIQVLQKAVDFSRELKEGELERFKLGATSLLIVNIRERDVLKATEAWIDALADYQKAVALYHWATGRYVAGYNSSPEKPKEKDVPSD